MAIKRRVPGNRLEFDSSRNTSSNITTRTLIVGLTDKDVPSELSLLNSPNRARELYGCGQVLTMMVEKFVENNPSEEIWIYPISEEEDWLSASATFEISGEALDSGVLLLNIMGDQLEVVVSRGQSDSDVKAVIHSLLKQGTETDYQVYSVLSDSGELSFHHKNKGDFANNELIRIESIPSGFEALNMILTGGVGGYRDLKVLIDNLGDVHYTTMVFYQYNRSTLFNAEASLEARFGSDIQREIHVWVGRRSEDFNDLPTTLNSKHISVQGYKGSPTPSYVWVSAIAGSAVESLSLDPALPLKTKEVYGIIAPSPTDRFDEKKREYLLNNGVSTFKVDGSDRVRIERIITTYLTNGSGAVDESYLDTTTYYTLGWLRRDYLNVMDLKYARKKLGRDGGEYDPEANVVTPSDIFNETVSLLGEWESAGFIEDKKTAIDQISIKKEGDGLSIEFGPDLINKLLSMDIKMSFIK